MKTIQLQKSLPDGRVVNFHRIHEISFIAPAGTIIVLLGSWESFAGAFGMEMPASVQEIQVSNGGNIQAVIEGFLEHLLTLPEWSGGVLEQT
jgi:hypothetical protein